MHCRYYRKIYYPVAPPVRIHRYFLACKCNTVCRRTVHELRGFLHTPSGKGCKDYPQSVSYDIVEYVVHVLERAVYLA